MPNRKTAFRVFSDKSKVKTCRAFGLGTPSSRLSSCKTVRTTWVIFLFFNLGHCLEMFLVLTTWVMVFFLTLVTVFVSVFFLFGLHNLGHSICHCFLSLNLLVIFLVVVIWTTSGVVSVTRLRVQ